MKTIMGYERLNPSGIKDGKAKTARYVTFRNVFREISGDNSQTLAQSGPHEAGYSGTQMLTSVVRRCLKRDNNKAGIPFGLVFLLDRMENDGDLCHNYRYPEILPRVVPDRQACLSIYLRRWTMYP